MSDPAAAGGTAADSPQSDAAAGASAGVAQPTQPTAAPVANPMSEDISPARGPRPVVTTSIILAGFGLAAWIGLTTTSAELIKLRTLVVLSALLWGSATVFVWWRSRRPFAPAAVNAAAAAFALSAGYAATNMPPSPPPPDVCGKLCMAEIKESVSQAVAALPKVGLTARSTPVVASSSRRKATRQAAQHANRRANSSG